MCFRGQKKRSRHSSRRCITRRMKTTRVASITTSLHQPSFGEEMKRV
ncbi:hypothetical protein LINPERPRIM_LOCUS19334 [Linum perenne]